MLRQFMRSLSSFTLSLPKLLITVFIVGFVGLIFGINLPAIAQFRPDGNTTNPRSSLTRWEYQSISTSEASDPGNARFFRELSSLGEEGYEMVTCLYAQERRDEESTTVCYLKRPKR